MMVLASTSTIVPSLVLLGALPWVNRLDIGCFEFLAWWWIVYFTRSHRCATKERLQMPPRPYTLFTLRSYLDQISSHRASIWSGREKTEADFKVDENLIREKSRSSRDVQGIMIAVVVLLLTLIVIDPATAAPKGHLDHYQHLVRGVIFALGLVIVLVWALSLDIFDSILNSFNVNIEEALHLRRYYYRDMGPLNWRFVRSSGFSGGVSYGYVGHALLPIFTLMVFSWFQPVLVGFGTAAFLFFAYPYFFGYWAIDSESMLGHCRPPASGPRWQVTIDGDQAVRTVSQPDADGHTAVEVHREQDEEERRPRASVWPQILLGLLFLVPSILLAVVK